MERVFKTRSFNRWARRVGLADATLRRAVDEMLAGKIDAQLGGNLVKQRVALPGRGKRGSTRTIVATNRGDRWFFVHGFEKNERENIDADELETLQDLAVDLLNLSPAQLDAAARNGMLEELP
jgi:hypothetical protein